MTVLDVKKAINIELAKAFETLPVYLERVPKDFKRPSFLLQTVHTKMDAAAANMVKITVDFTIVCFTTVDLRQSSSSTALLDLQSGVFEIFRKGYIKCGDRSPGIYIKNGTINELEAYVDLEVSWQDVRSMKLPEQPLASKVNVDYKIN